MKYISIFILGAIIFAAGCSKAPLPTEPGGEPELTPTQIGKLVVTAIEEGGLQLDSATVYLNGDCIGLTPLSCDLPSEGICALRVQKEPYQIFKQCLTIESESSVYVEATLTRLPEDNGQLLVTVDQDSCQIQLLDIANTLIHDELGREVALVLPSAGYFITVSKSGFESVKRATSIRADSITIENLKLTPIENIAAPEIELLVSDSVLINQPVLVQWSARNATRVDIDFLENPGLSGKREISFGTPGVRVISATAYNESLTAVAKDTVIIYEKAVKPLDPPTLAFEVQPEIADVGEPVQLSWRTSGRYVMIDHGIGIRGTEGRDEVVFDSPGLKIFTAVAYSKSGLTTIVKDSVTINLPQQALLPEITLNLPDSAIVGQPVLIQWHASNATLVDVDYLGSVGLNGKSEITFESTGLRIVSATAYNIAGDVTVQDTVVIYELPIDEVEPITITCNAVVAANHYSIPQVRDAAEVDIQIPGYYRVIAEVDFNSGDNQKNESFFILVEDPAGSLRSPLDPNAGLYKVVPDDPGPAHLAYKDAGTFYLSKGMNTIELHHYAEIADEYPDFAVEAPITGAESVRIFSFTFEFVPLL